MNKKPFREQFWPTDDLPYIPLKWYESHDKIIENIKKEIKEGKFQSKSFISTTVECNDNENFWNHKNL